MKLSAWLFTLIGVVWLLPLLGVNLFTAATTNWIIGLSLLIMGIAKLTMMQGKGKRRR